MRKILVLLFSVFYIISFAQVKWMTMDEALNAQKIQPKKIIVDFYADWCGPCKLMDKKTYGHPVIADYINQNYYPVKFNAEGKESVTIYGKTFRNPEFQDKKGRNAMHEFTQFMNVNSVPSLVFLDEFAKPITILNGLLEAKEIEPYLTMISTNEYLKIRSRQEWDDYQKKFKSKLKN